MKINFDRLSQLAGISSSSKKSLNEGAHYEGMGHYDEGEEHADTDKNEAYYEASAIDGLEEILDEVDGDISEEKEEPKDEAYEMNLDEMIEVDEVMLVQELRRMKKLMEAKKRSQLLEARKLEQKKQALIEQRLKEVIDDEVKDILNKLNYNSGWIYGDNKPKNSKHGYSHQGSFLKGLGFK
jgi:superfamily II DNA/RNA helicase